MSKPSKSHPRYSISPPPRFVVPYRAVAHAIAQAPIYFIAARFSWMNRMWCGICPVMR